MPFYGFPVACILIAVTFLENQGEAPVELHSDDQVHGVELPSSESVFAIPSLLQYLLPRRRLDSGVHARGVADFSVHLGDPPGCCRARDDGQGHL